MYTRSKMSTHRGTHKLLIILTPESEPSLPVVAAADIHCDITRNEGYSIGSHLNLQCAT